MCEKLSVGDLQADDDDQSEKKPDRDNAHKLAENENRFAPAPRRPLYHELPPDQPKRKAALALTQVPVDRSVLPLSASLAMIRGPAANSSVGFQKPVDQVSVHVQ